ncbi:MAG: anti-sigma factor family protein [Chloroflexota bacterium]
MECRLEERAFRYSEGTLDREERADFQRHMATCPVCQQAVRANESMDELLRAALAPESVPAGLEARILAGLPTATVGRFERRLAPSFSLFWLRPRAVAAALVVALIAGAMLFTSPSEVVARLREALYFVPGVGITATDEASLANGRAVSTEVGGLRLTVPVLISNHEGTRIKFEVTGLPGGKEAWTEPTIVPSNVGSPVNIPEQGQPRPRFSLIDSSGRSYKLLSFSHSVGGDVNSNTLRGEVNFERLAAETREVTLVAPLRALLPPALAESDAEWRLSIPLVAVDAADFASAKELHLTQSKYGVRVDLIAASFTRESTALSIRVSSEREGVSPVCVGKRLTPDEVMPRLVNAQGQVYGRKPLDEGGRWLSNPLELPFAFEPVPRDAKQLQFVVPVISVEEPGEATLRVPLAGRRAGDEIQLDTKLHLGQHTLRAESATLERREDGRLDLIVNLDLGPREGDRQLVGLEVAAADTFGSWQSWDGRSGQLSAVSVPMAEGEQEATIKLHKPLIAIYGDWTFDFSVSEQ